MRNETFDREGRRREKAPARNLPPFPAVVKRQYKSASNDIHCAENWEQTNGDFVIFLSSIKAVSLVIN